LVENNGVPLEAGKQLIFAMDENLLGTSEKVGTTYTSMYLDVNVGERILMDDGNLEVKVISIDKVKKEVLTEVIYGGILKSKKGINLPGTKVSLPCLTPKDEEDFNISKLSNAFLQTAITKYFASWITHASKKSLRNW
jgi:pyruvate kinase